MLNQVLKITLVGLQGIGGRIGASLVTVIGTAGVVGVLCGLFALAAGLDATARDTARMDRGVVLRNGSIIESTSYYSGDAVGRLQQVDEIEAVSGELLFYLPMPNARSEDTLVLLRAVDRFWQTVRPEIKITHGRLFSPGKREVIVGRGLLQQFPGLTVGATMPIYQGELLVVGHFEAQGGMDESASFADIEVFRDSYKRGNAVNTVRVVLRDADVEAMARERIETDSQASFRLVMEAELLKEHVRERQDLITSFAYWVVAIMAVGALVASLSTMFNAVTTRVREIATLRALGFSNWPIVIALLIEAITLSLLGAILGAGIAYVMFDGLATATTGGLRTTLIFAFQVTPKIVGVSIVIAVVLGLLGGIAAGARATRMSLTSALAGKF